MPDVTHMKAKEMRQELESYGIKTNTLFDKREFEQALIEARHQYEQTLDDVMSSTRPKKKKTVQTQRKTVNYERGRHSDERIYTSDVGGGSDQKRQQQAREHRPHRHYQAQPDPMGGGFHTYPNGAQNNGGNNNRRGSTFFEEDPLFAHEAQHYREHDDHHRHGEQEHYQEYEVGGRQRQQQTQATYNDPAVELKYLAALQDAYNMKVGDLQHELNCRGISTKYCMVFKDFCQEYAKAVADDREKVVKEESEDDDDDASASFGDDHDDYDPLYKDVVMQKYDPSMWI